MAINALGLPNWYTGAVHMGIKMAGPWKHPSGIYYLRRRVPADLVDMGCEGFAPTLVIKPYTLLKSEADGEGRQAVRDVNVPMCRFYGYLVEFMG